MKRIVQQSIFLIFISLNLQAQEVNILDFGADPSGKFENSDLINKLVDSLSTSGGGTVYVPKGKYLLNDAILLKSNISLKGENSNETIFFRDSVKGGWSISKAQGLITTNPAAANHNIHVSHVQVNGNFKKKASRGKAGIALRNCSKSSIKDVQTFNTWHGVAFYDFKGDDSQNIIDRVISTNAHTFTSKDNSGRPRGILSVDPGSKILNSKSFNAGTGFYAYGKNITLEGNHAEGWFEDNGYYLIVDNLTVKNCSAKGGPSPEKGYGSGFAIGYKKGALIENNLAENCDNYGFRIHVPQSNTKLINNRAIGCGNGFGIETASHPYPEVSSDIYMEGNLAQNSGIHGFLFRQMENSQVLNNKAINGNQRMLTLSTRGAIALKDYLKNNTFSNNICEDNQNKKTQLYGLYDFSVNDIKSASKKGKNNKIKHKSKSGKDVF